MYSTNNNFSYCYDCKEAGAILIEDSALYETGSFYN